MKRAYFDNAATTKVDPIVAKTMSVYMTEKYGNASSLHSFGKDAHEALIQSRKLIASSINADETEIVFTSGGTEANNLAIKGLAMKQDKTKKNNIITSKIEHPSVSNVLKELEKQGFTITWLDVDHEGFINLDQLKNTITEKTFLVTLIHGNNEIGTIQDLDSIGKICKEKNIVFHIDACQSYTKTELDVKKQNLSMASLNAHKLHGPKGVGALYVSRNLSMESQIIGGGQERKLRSGTENIPGILGFAQAVKLSQEKDIKKMKSTRDKIIAQLLKIKDSRLNGPRGDKRLANNINVSFFGVEGEAILSILDSKGIAVSTGSACSSSSLKASHVLTAIGLKDSQSHGSLRITLSRFTTTQEASFLIKEINKAVTQLRKISIYYETNNKTNEAVRAFQISAVH